MDNVNPDTSERKNETERNMRILGAVEPLVSADQKREKIVGKMIKSERAKGRPLFDCSSYDYGDFRIRVAGRCIRYWRKGRRAEKRIDADIVLCEDESRWWKSLSISDTKGESELSEGPVPTIKERYGKWPDYPYTETVHVLGDAGTGILITVCVHLYSGRSVIYKRDEMTGEYEVTNSTGSTLSHLGLPEDLRKAKYVQGIPIKDMLEIDFEAAALRIAECAELDELMKAVGLRGE